jgi:hypothetical protein
MVVSIVSLLVALSGSSYAAIRLGHGSVGSAQIRDGSVRSTDLARSARAAQPVLRSGQTMRGYVAAAGGGSTRGFIGEGVTFPRRLPADFHADHVKYLNTHDPFTATCPGPGKAKRGWMCFYEGERYHASVCCIYDQHYNSLAVAPYGFRIYWSITGSVNYADGQWAVRAP